MAEGLQPKNGEPHMLPGKRLLRGEELWRAWLREDVEEPWRCGQPRQGAKGTPVPAVFRRNLARGSGPHLESVRSHLFADTLGHALRGAGDPHREELFARLLPVFLVLQCL